MNYLNVFDPWKGLENIKGVLDSKKALISNYKIISKIPILPRFRMLTKADFVIIGFSNYLKFSPKIKKKSHVIFKPRDIWHFKFKIFECFLNFTLDFKVYKEIYLKLTQPNKDNFYNDYYIKHTLEIVNPKVLIISSTIDPFQRLWVYWAKELRIKVVCIQHGVFASYSAPEIKERDIVDFYIGYTPQQSELIKKVIPIKKHRWLFSKDSFIYNFKKKRAITFCLVGTDYERYGNEGIKIKKNILKIYIKFIQYILEKSEINLIFIYKKHPSEKLFSPIDKYARIQAKVNYNSIDIFVGTKSTMLINAASMYKCAVQLLSNSIRQDNYQKLGFCLSVPLSEIRIKGLKILDGKEYRMPYLRSNNLSRIISEIAYKQ